MTDVSQLITQLQDLNLDEQELAALVARLTKDGLTEPVRRQVRAVVVQAMNRDVEELERYERVLDGVRTYNQRSEQIVKEGEQALNRIDMRTKATFESMNRKIDEDAQAQQAGATLLLHTDDVAPPAGLADRSVAQPLQPKAAAATVIAAARRSASETPLVMAPVPAMSPSLPSLPRNEPLPATMAPLPPTPIAPPAVTEPTR